MASHVTIIMCCFLLEDNKSMSWRVGLFSAQFILAIVGVNELIYLYPRKCHVCYLNEATKPHLHRYISTPLGHHYTPGSTRLKGSILVSPCPSVHPSVEGIVSILYLPQYSPDPFHFTHFINMINQLKKVCCILMFFKFKIWIFEDFVCLWW